MDIGTISRNHGGYIQLCTGPVSYPFMGIDIRLAIDFYGSLLGRNETITTLEWVRRIRRTYGYSKKRNVLVRAIVTASRTELPKRSEIIKK